MAQAGVISYPVPIYNNNIPIEAQYYQPSKYFITAITLGQTTIVTTALNNDFDVGQLCRILIPFGYGSRELHTLTGYMISQPAPNQVELNIDSTQFTPFSVGPGTELPQLIPIGDINTGAINTNPKNMQTFINGSFINVSP
jgi:hypothetical protein